MRYLVIVTPLQRLWDSSLSLTLRIVTLVLIFIQAFNSTFGLDSGGPTHRHTPRLAFLTPLLAMISMIYDL